jgi:hypothetical protein
VTESHDSGADVDAHEFASDDTTQTEETPLLASETSSHTLRNASPSGIEAAQRAAEDDDVPNQRVGLVRGLIIIISTWLFIFLQGESFRDITRLKSGRCI